jgi:hypothetical protein
MTEIVRVKKELKFMYLRKVVGETYSSVPVDISDLQSKLDASNPNLRTYVHDLRLLFTKKDNQLCNEFIHTLYRKSPILQPYGCVAVQIECHYKEGKLDFVNLYYGLSRCNKKDSKNFSKKTAREMAEARANKVQLKPQSAFNSFNYVYNSLNGLKVVFYEQYHPSCKLQEPNEILDNFTDHIRAYVVRKYAITTQEVQANG